MKITIYNFKGGVGKTRIAANIAMTLGFGIVTNDPYSPLTQLFPEEKCLVLDPDAEMPVLPDEYDIVFDLGGYPDQRAVQALKQSDAVLLPTCNVDDEIFITLNTIAEIQDISKNLAVIANRVKDSDLKAITKSIKDVVDLPIFPLKNTKALEKMFAHKSSIHALVDEGGLNRYLYLSVKEQFDDIFNYLNQVN